MTRRLVTVPSQATIRQAAALMAERNVGGLVVAVGSRPVGVITERDVARRVVAAGLDPETTLVERVMSTPVAWIEPSAQVEEAAEKMKRLGVKRLVVLFEGETRGIVTVTDIAYASPALHRSLIDGWVKGRWED